jgi:hypothetical protein
LVACLACSHRPPATAPSAARTGTVEGRVLWNEQAVPGAHVYATAEYNFQSTHFGDAMTDASGHFSIRSVPPGQKYLYVFGTGQPFWVTAVTPVLVSASAATTAPDSHLCKGFDPTAPAPGERLDSPRPVLKWNPYPDATTYAVRVIRRGANSAAFSRGDTDPHISATSANVDLDLAPGVYNWRVDAFNANGHIIGCSYFARSFTVTGAVRPTAAPNPRDAAAPLTPRIDPDHDIFGIPLGTTVAQFVTAYGAPTGEMHVSAVDTTLLYGRSTAFFFESDRLVGGFFRAAGYILDMRLTDKLVGTTRFDALRWQLSNGVENGMSVTAIRKILGDKLQGGCSLATGVVRLCYFTTENARVDLDILPRPIPGAAGPTGDDGIVAVGLVVRATRRPQ